MAFTVNICRSCLRNNVLNKPIVSFLMPVYNTESTIRRAIDSMLNQTYQNFEIVIIIDGCTDETAAICDEYAHKDKRICIYVNEKNLGVAASLNFGMSFCKGDYIARMDADDVSLPDRLEKQIAYMEAHPEIGVLGSGCNVLDESGVFITEPTLKSEMIRVRLLFETAFTHPTVMLRGKLFRENHWQYPLVHGGEDYALWASLISKTKMANIPESLVDYYKHGDNLTFVKFLAVRAVSAEISRQALFDELGIDTTMFSDTYFGWRGGDPVPYDIRLFLADEAKLLSEVQSSNDRLQKFDSEALSSVLIEQWERTKYYARMNTLALGFCEVTPAIIDKAVALWEIIFCTTAKVIIYGTGQYCSSILQKLAGSHIFEIVAFCDSDVKKQGTFFSGKPVIAPEEITAFTYDYIFIASLMYEREIRYRLVNELGFAEGQIFILPATNDYEMSFHSRHRQYKRLYTQMRENQRKAYLFCAPDYGNLGDHAIAEAEHRFFIDKLGLKIVEIPCGVYNEAALIAAYHILPSDLILITGGGFMGSLWFSAEFQAREVVKTYINNPIVILPQTLFWEDSEYWREERKKTQRIYAAHPNLTFCARDRETQRLVRELYPNCRVLLVPDMVLSCGWDGWFDDSLQRCGALICLHEDKESIISDVHKMQLCNLGKKLCETVIVSNTDSKEPVSIEERAALLRAKLNEFRGAKLIITDRLHGLIFAVVTGTPCVALDNCNHKLRETFIWVRHLPYLRFAGSVDNVEAMAKQVLAEGCGRFNEAEFSRLFDVLENQLRSKE